VKTPTDKTKQTPQGGTGRLDLEIQNKHSAFGGCSACDTKQTAPDVSCFVSQAKQTQPTAKS
jgi:hypothetical protein